MFVVDWLLELPLVVSIVVQLAAWMLLAAVAVWVGRRLPHAEREGGRSPNLSLLLGVITGFYAFLLGFLIVQEWNNANTARIAMSQEAAALVTVSYNASLFPTADYTRIRDALIDYDRAIVCDELPQLARGGGPSTSAVAAHERIYVILAGLPASTRSLPSFNHALRQLNTATTQRRIRLDAATLRLPGVLLVLIVVAAGTLVCVAAFQASGHRVSHTTAIVALALFVGFAVSLVVELNTPYRGAAAISDEPLRLGVSPDDLRCT